MALDLSKYKGLIFDMDGTLIDTMPAHLDAWEKTASKFNIPYDRDWIHSMGGMPSPKITLEINQRYGLELDPKIIATYKMQCFDEIEQQGEVIPHTFQVLKSAQGLFKTALGTGSQRSGAMKLLGDRKLLPFLQEIVTATDVTRHKPNPDTFLLAAEKLNLAPETCVVFEDTELGKQAAHAAGMDCFMVVGEDFEFHPRP
ncbi:carotenoid dehydrogenase [Vibrio sp. HA2012]|uniref:beta-phosphoglucomutase family hydrolase n=1 Tax=Vibrio sp. HA2012 TaxID=1971595 RepID=UPI000C2C21CB|nr:beta-phosphoglucomutase family hydrolase [Vibrio sp. HA2012]PJC87368.1 carotenoid dehydrogenase [Vibrio sp. HA2012]